MYEVMAQLWLLLGAHKSAAQKSCARLLPLGPEVEACLLWLAFVSDAGDPIADRRNAWSSGHGARTTSMNLGVRSSIDTRTPFDVHARHRPVVEEA